jgi:hypothetical protein
VDLILLAEPAVATNPAQPGNAHTFSDWKISRRAFDDFSYDLVTGYQVGLNRR